MPGDELVLDMMGDELVVDMMGDELVVGMIGDELVDVLQSGGAQFWGGSQLVSQHGVGGLQCMGSGDGAFLQLNSSLPSVHQDTPLHLDPAGMHCPFEHLN